MTTITNNSIVNRLAHRAAFCSIFGAGLLALSSFAMGQTMPAAQPPASLFPLPAPVVSTVPSNGDVNPYGVFFAPPTIPTDGILQPSDILVSNFNNSQNLQGTGSTIVRVDAHSNVTTFFQSPSVGLTAALGVTQRGVVFIGNLPTADGTSNTVQPGSLMAVDRNGKFLGALTDPKLVNGPWGMAIFDRGKFVKLFFSNVLSGTVTRLDLEISDNGEGVFLLGAYQIAAGFNHRTDPAALVLGPSGLFYDSTHDILYVASSFDNAVYALPNASWRADATAGTGTMIYQDNVHLHGPIQMVMTPNGHLIVANSDGSNADPNQPSELVEFTVNGTFVAQYSVDKNNGGAFGVGLSNLYTAVRMAAVDDNANTLSIFVEPLH